KSSSPDRPDPSVGQSDVRRSWSHGSPSPLSSPYRRTAPHWKSRLLPRLKDAQAQIPAARLAVPGGKIPPRAVYVNAAGDFRSADENNEKLGTKAVRVPVQPTVREYGVFLQ